MLKITEFDRWLHENTQYSARVISNNISRLKRANKILPIQNDKIYLFRLSEAPYFIGLSASVKSQIRKAVKLYFLFLEETHI